jgi:ABC-type antimicrobial peptide transport system permease subunit
VLNAALLGPFAAAAGITVSTVAILSFAGAAYPAWVASRMMPIEAMRSV